MIAFSSSEEENIEEWLDPRGDQPNLIPFICPSGFIIENLNIRSDVAIETYYLWTWTICAREIVQGNHQICMRITAVRRWILTVLGQVDSDKQKWNKKDLLD